MLSSCLESKSLTSSSNNSALDLRGIKKVVLVFNGGKGSLKGLVLGITKVIIALDGVSFVSRVEGLLAVDEDVALDENLGTDTGVDAVAHSLVVVVVDVAGTEAD